MRKARFKVRDFILKSDLQSCLALLDQHNLNEKYYNQEFPVEGTQIIFKNWFKAQTKTDGATILVLCDVTKGDKVVGVSIHSKPKSCNEMFDKNLITWDIAVLDKDERGRGLATILFSEIVAREKADIEGSAMADNLMLQKFVHKFGFFIVGAFVFVGKSYKY